MRVVLADLESGRGFVNKDTVVGGYGQRMTGFSGVTRLGVFLRKRLQDRSQRDRWPTWPRSWPAAGHEVVWTRRRGARGGRGPRPLLARRLPAGDPRGRTSARARGLRVGFVGIAASKLPHLFRPARRLHRQRRARAGGDAPRRGARRSRATCKSEEIADLDALPFPRWDLVGVEAERARRGEAFTRPLGAFSLLASRSCPEFCTYCPHRILSTYRSRSVENIADELEQLCDAYPQPFVVFRDPLFSQDRERMPGPVRRDSRPRISTCAGSARRASTASTRSC